MEKKIESKSLVKTLCVLTMLTLAGVVIATGNQWADRAQAVVALLVASALGLIALLVAVEEYWALLPGKTFAFGGAVLVSALAYWAQLEGAGYVNQVFHVDASALPATTLLATVFAGVIGFKWGFLFLCVGGFLWFLTGTFRVDNLLKLALSSALAASGLVGFFFGTLTLNGEGRSQMLYKFALRSEMYTETPCTNLPKDSYVAFLGPEHRRVLVAPDPKFSSSVRASTPSPLDFDAKAEIPKTFPVMECVLN